MQDGRVVLQVGAPEAIYARPAAAPSPPSSACRTCSRRRPGRCTGSRVGRPCASTVTAGDGWCSADEDVKPGESVIVIVRSEAIQLGHAAGRRLEQGIAWSGVVRQRLFRGTRNLYPVDVGPHRFSVDAPPDQPLAPGPAVWLAVDATQTWVVRE